jgi:hypothetical protein
MFENQMSGVSGSCFVGSASIDCWRSGCVNLNIQIHVDIHISTSTYTYLESSLLFYHISHWSTISEHRLLKKRVRHIQSFKTSNTYIYILCIHGIYSLLPLYSLSSLFHTYQKPLHVWNFSPFQTVWNLRRRRNAWVRRSVWSISNHKPFFHISVQTFESLILFRTYKSFTRFKTSNLTHFVQIFERQEAEECVGPEICLKHIQPKALYIHVF